MRKKQDSKVVSLPSELYGRIDERVKATGFGSVDEYVVFVMEEVLKEDEKGGGERVFSEEEEAEVKKRLRDLGYLD